MSILTSSPGVPHLVIMKEEISLTVWLSLLREELGTVQRKTVFAAEVRRAVTLFDPVWDMLLVRERFRILHLLLESVVYDGATLAFYPLGITSLAAEAGMVGQPAAEAA